MLIIMGDIALFNLFNFMPLNEEEKELFNFDKLIIDAFISDLDKGFFYLGGQLKMCHNDFINLDSIKRVREIDRKREIEYGGPANMLELVSINNHKKQLEFIENMIIKYNEIMKIRENNKSNDLYFNNNI